MFNKDIRVSKSSSGGGFNMSVSINDNLVIVKNMSYNELVDLEAQISQLLKQEEKKRGNI